MIKAMEWVKLADVIPELYPRMAVNDGGKFITDNWHCKYIDVRIDMRTGSCFVRPGNVTRPMPEAPSTLETKDDGR